MAAAAAATTTTSPRAMPPPSPPPGVTTIEIPHCRARTRHVIHTVVNTASEALAVRKRPGYEMRDGDGDDDDIGNVIDDVQSRERRSPRRTIAVLSRCCARPPGGKSPNENAFLLALGTERLQTAIRVHISERTAFSFILRPNNVIYR